MEQKEKLGEKRDITEIELQGGLFSAEVNHNTPECLLPTASGSSDEESNTVSQWVEKHLLPGAQNTVIFYSKHSKHAANMQLVLCSIWHKS